MDSGSRHPDSQPRPYLPRPSRPPHPPGPGPAYAAPRQPDDRASRTAVRLPPLSDLLREIDSRPGLDEPLSAGPGTQSPLYPGPSSYATIPSRPGDGRLTAGAPPGRASSPGYHQGSVWRSQSGGSAAPPPNLSAQSYSSPPPTSQPQIGPAVERGRGRRRQVRRACINCQKACKACSDSRPCPRCIANSTEDTCVDAPRKAELAATEELARRRASGSTSQYGYEGFERYMPAGSSDLEPSPEEAGFAPILLHRSRSGEASPSSAAYTAAGPSQPRYQVSYEGYEGYAGYEGYEERRPY